MIKTKKGQGVFLPVMVAVVFLLFTMVVWVTSAPLRNFVHEKFPALYDVIPKLEL